MNKTRRSEMLHKQGEGVYLDSEVLAKIPFNKLDNIIRINGAYSILENSIRVQPTLGRATQIQSTGVAKYVLLDDICKQKGK